MHREDGVSLGLTGCLGEPRLRKKGRAFQAKATAFAKVRRQESTWLGHPRAYFVDIALLVKAVSEGGIGGDRDDFHVTQPGHSSLIPDPQRSKTSELTSISCHGAVWKS